MIEVGTPIPAARVWIEPDDRSDGLTLDSLAGDTPFVLLFYLYDWTGT
jgi:hypothetical protein